MVLLLLLNLRAEWPGYYPFITTTTTTTHAINFWKASYLPDSGGGVGIGDRMKRKVLLPGYSSSALRSNDDDTIHHHLCPWPTIVLTWWWQAKNNAMMPHKEILACHHLTQWKNRWMMLLYYPWPWLRAAAAAAAVSREVSCHRHHHHHLQQHFLKDIITCLSEINGMGGGGGGGGNEGIILLVILLSQCFWNKNSIYIYMISLLT